MIQKKKQGRLTEGCLKLNVVKKEKYEETVPKQNMTQAIIQTVIEAAKAAIMTMREAEGPTKYRRPAHLAQRTSGPTLRQATYDAAKKQRIWCDKECKAELWWHR